MVCPRCTSAVVTIGQKLDLPISVVALGEVESRRQLSEAEKAQFGDALSSIGLELLDDTNSIIISRLKSVIQHYNQTIENQSQNLSQYITDQIPTSYSTLSRLFSSVEGITIEKYSIIQKIEMVKELLSYEQLSVKEIAYRLNFSSPSYLSSLFKKETGMSISSFRQVVGKKRQNLDSL